MNNISESRSFGSTLPGPLHPAADMAPVWRDLDLNFDQAANVVLDAHRQDGAARDLPVLDLRLWGIVPLNGRFGLAPLARHHEPRVLRANAFSNMMTRLGAPSEFIRDKLPAPLQVATANWLMSAEESPMSATLRLRGNDIAAIVSGRYAALDQEELLDGLRAALVRHGVLDSVRIRSIATGLVDAVRIVIPAEHEAVKVGDVSCVGLDVTSSSFGRSALHVRGMLWRLKCTNGLRVPERSGSFSFRHMGEAQRLRDGLADAVPSAIAQARGVMSAWKKSVNVMVERVADMIEQMRELTVGEKKAVSEELKTDVGVPMLPDHVNLYSLVNAVTAAAHSATPARRLEMEGLAGDLLLRHGGRA